LPGKKIWVLQKSTYRGQIQDERALKFQRVKRQLIFDDVQLIIIRGLILSNINLDTCKSATYTFNELRKDSVSGKHANK
jgi:hypothetical protein